MIHGRRCLADLDAERHARCWVLVESWVRCVSNESSLSWRYPVHRTKAHRRQALTRPAVCRQSTCWRASRGNEPQLRGRYRARPWAHPWSPKGCLIQAMSSALRRNQLASELGSRSTRLRAGRTGPRALRGGREHRPWGQSRGLEQLDYQGGAVSASSESSTSRSLRRGRRGLRNLTGSPGEELVQRLTDDKVHACRCGTVVTTM